MNVCSGSRQPTNEFLELMHDSYSDRYELDALRGFEKEQDDSFLGGQDIPATDYVSVCPVSRNTTKKKKRKNSILIKNCS